MARSRRPKKDEVNETQDVTNDKSAQSATTQGENKMSAFENMVELSADDITALLSDTRSHGEYGEYLKEFIASGKVGIEVDFNHPLLVGKDAEKAKVGFENAKKATIKDTDPPQLKVAGAGGVKVVKRNTGTKDEPEWHLFLINTAVASQAKAAA